MVPHLPIQYVFFLVCCYQDNCLHPCCQAGEPSEPIRWYPGGPPITHLPFPIPDPDRPWGNLSCSTCTGSNFCSGHYMVKMVDVKNTSALKELPKPPSITTKEVFATRRDDELSDEFIQELSKRVLLPPEECRIWLEHLKTILENRRRGAQKAAETRRLRRQQASAVRTQSEVVPSQSEAVQSQSEAIQGQNKAVQSQSEAACSQSGPAHSQRKSVRSRSQSVRSQSNAISHELKRSRSTSKRSETEVISIGKSKYALT